MNAVIEFYVHCELHLLSDWLNKYLPGAYKTHIWE